MVASILLIDDDMLVRSTLEDTLMHRGIQCGDGVERRRRRGHDEG